MDIMEKLRGVFPRPKTLREIREAKVLKLREIKECGSLVELFHSPNFGSMNELLSGISTDLLAIAKYGDNIRNEYENRQNKDIDSTNYIRLAEFSKRIYKEEALDAMKVIDEINLRLMSVIRRSDQLNMEYKQLENKERELEEKLKQSA